MMLQLQKFIFSIKNIVGCFLSFLVIVGAFLGFIKAFWLPIALMAYVFGYIATPKKQEIKFYHIKGENYSDYIGFINKMKNVTESSKKLPDEAKLVINKISKTANELLEFLIKDPNNISLGQDMANFTSIFDSYLPKIINQYERLPSDYANKIKSSNGKTAKEMLLDQLTILDDKVKEIAYGMYENDVTALRANGYFLKEKFSKSNLFELQMNA